MADSVSTATASSGFESHLEEYPCHFVWELEENCGRDFKTAMDYIDHHIRYSPEQMPVPAKALKAYLYMSDLSGNGSTDPVSALQWIDKALQVSTETRVGLDHDGPEGDRVILLADKAWVYLKLGKLDEVDCLIRELEIAYANLSTEAEAYLNAHKAFAFQWFGHSKCSEAISCFKQALEVFPSNVDWLFGYTRFCEKTEKLSQEAHNGVTAVSKIEQNLRKILEFNPRHGLARILLARRLVRKGSTMEADEQVQMALELDGNNLVVVQRAGEVYRLMSKYDEALELLDEARDSESDSSFTLRQIGCVYKDRYFKGKRKRDQSNLVVALDYFEQAVKADGSNFLAKCDVAYTHSLIVNNDDQTRTKYCQLVETAARDDRAMACFYFGEFLRKKNEEANAIEQYKNAIRAQPDSYGGEKAVSKLVGLMRQRLSLNEDDYEALKLLGWIYKKAGFIDSACFYYEKAYQLVNDEKLALALAELNVKAVDSENARKYIALIPDVNSKPYRRLTGELHLVQGRELEEGGDIEEARKCYSLAAEHDSLEGAENLVRVLRSCEDHEKFEQLWFENCARVAALGKKEALLIEQHRGKIKQRAITKRLESLQDDLRQIAVPNVRHLTDLHEKYIQFLSLSDNDREAVALIRNAADVLLEARGLLDRVMSDFQKRIYKITDPRAHCPFFFIKSTSHPVEYSLQRKIEGGYKWLGFRQRFPDLFQRLVECQPAFDFNKNKNLIFLFWIVNLHKHNKRLHREEEVVIDGILHRVNLRNLAEWSVINVSQIVREFDKYM